MDDVMFGFITSGRDIPLEKCTEIIGPCVTTVPTRIKFKEFCHSSTIEYLRTIQDNSIVESTYSYYGLPDIQKVCDCSKTGVSLFHTLLNYLNFSSEIMPECSLPFEIKEVNEKTEINYPLSIDVIRSANDLQLHASYDCILIQEEEMECILNHFINAINSVIENPEGKILDLNIMNDMEKIALSSGLRDPSFETIENVYLHQLVEKQAMKTSDAIAVLDDFYQITYENLNRQASYLAQYLRDLGVNSKTIVPLYMDKSINLPLVVLAVLKADGCYLPLNTSDPISRTKFIVQQVKATILISSEKYGDRLQEVSDVCQIRILESLMHHIQDFTGDVISIEKQHFYQ